MPEVRASEESTWDLMGTGHGPSFDLAATTLDETQTLTPHPDVLCRRSSEEQRLQQAASTVAWAIPPPAAVAVERNKAERDLWSIIDHRRPSNRSCQLAAAFGTAAAAESTWQTPDMVSEGNSVLSPHNLAQESTSACDGSSVQPLHNLATPPDDSKPTPHARDDGMQTTAQASEPQTASREGPGSAAPTTAGPMLSCHQQQQPHQQQQQVEQPCGAAATPAAESIRKYAWKAAVGATAAATGSAPVEAAAAAAQAAMTTGEAPKVAAIGGGCGAPAGAGVSAAPSMGTSEEAVPSGKPPGWPKASFDLENRVLTITKHIQALTEEDLLQHADLRLKSVSHRNRTAQQQQATMFKVADASSGSASSSNSNSNSGGGGGLQSANRGTTMPGEGGRMTLAQYGGLTSTPSRCNTLEDSSKGLPLQHGNAAPISAISSPIPALRPTPPPHSAATGQANEVTQQQGSVKAASSAALSNAVPGPVPPLHSVATESEYMTALQHGYTTPMCGMPLPVAALHTTPAASSPATDKGQAISLQPSNATPISSMVSAHAASWPAPVCVAAADKGQAVQSSARPMRGMASPHPGFKHTRSSAQHDAVWPAAPVCVAATDKGQAVHSSAAPMSGKALPSAGPKHTPTSAPRKVVQILEPLDGSNKVVASLKHHTNHADTPANRHGASYAASPTNRAQLGDAIATHGESFSKGYSMASELACPQGQAHSSHVGNPTDHLMGTAAGNLANGAAGKPACKDMGSLVGSSNITTDHLMGTATGKSANGAADQPARKDMDKLVGSSSIGSRATGSLIQRGMDTFAGVVSLPHMQPQPNPGPFPRRAAGSFLAHLTAQSDLLLLSSLGSGGDPASQPCSAGDLDHTNITPVSPPVAPMGVTHTNSGDALPSMAAQLLCSLLRGVSQQRTPLDLSQALAAAGLLTDSPLPSFLDEDIPQLVSDETGQLVPVPGHARNQRSLLFSTQPGSFATKGKTDLGRAVSEQTKDIWHNMQGMSRSCGPAIAHQAATVACMQRRPWQSTSGVASRPPPLETEILAMGDACKPNAPLPCAVQTAHMEHAIAAALHAHTRLRHTTQPRVLLQQDAPTHSRKHPLQVSAANIGQDGDGILSVAGRPAAARKYAGGSKRNLAMRGPASTWGDGDRLQVIMVVSVFSTCMLNTVVLVACLYVLRSFL